MKTVLTIAGFDPSSGAGVTADLMVFAAHGLFGTSAITALTIQSTKGVVDTVPVEAGTLRATLDCLEEDLPPVGIKIGMLATAENAAVVADYLEGLREQERRLIVVLDPVIRSSSGRELLDRRGIDLLSERLIPLVDFITPNLDELAQLTGFTVATREDVEAAALRLAERNSKLNVLATAGHLDPPDDFLLMAGDEGMWFQGIHVETTSTHGTGCALSSALLSRLVSGDGAVEACRAAKEYVAQGLRSAVRIGHGRGPLNLLWTLS